MNAVERVFSGLRGRRRAALIPYFMAGYPSREAFRSCLLGAEGADLIEIGIPFSDPIADGPVIRAASAAALKAGAGLASVLRELSLLKPGRLPAPVLLMSYLNPVLAYGLERLASDAESAGVAGFLIPDLELASAAPLLRTLQKRDLAFVPLAAPTTTDERLRHMASAATGFLYLVSVTGTTGVRNGVPVGLRRYVSRARGAARASGRPDLPLAVGFGIGAPATAAAVARIADGVVVGSALASALREGTEKAASGRALALLRRIRRAMDRARAGRTVQ